MKRRIALVLGVMILVSLVFSVMNVSASGPWYVDDSADAGGDGTTAALTGAHCAFQTITAAITAASPGDTINVAAGTYDQPINIEDFTGLTINGVDKTTVIVKPSSTLAFGVGGYGSSRTAVFRVVNSTNVVLQNMTMDFDLVKANSVHGILYWDSTGTVHNNILKNMSVSDAMPGGSYYEIGSYYRAPTYSDASRASITISENTFIDTGRLAVCTHDYVHATISDNTFYKTTADFGYAMEIGSESTATITGNTIYGYDTPAESDGSNSAGIYIENCFTGGTSGVTKNVSVTGNEIHDCQWALYIGNEFDGYSGDVDIVATVSGNDFHDNDDGAVALTDEDKADGSSVTATFQGNSVTNNGDYGYYIYTNGDGDITVDVTEDIITGHDTGVYVEDTAGGSSSSLYSVSANKSNLSGSTTYGVNNTVGSFTLDASANWWGTNTPAGVAAEVSATVDYTPWLDNGTDTSGDPGFQGDFSTLWVDDNSPQSGTTGRIQEGVDLVTGSTVHVANGTYNATTSNSTEWPGHAGEWWFVTIDKSLDLIGESRDGVILDGTGLQAENRCTGIWVSASNVTVKNLTIQNFTQTPPVTAACYGLYVMEKFRDYTWENVATLANVTAENLKATGNYYPFYFMKTEYATVKDCISENNGADGIWVAWGSHHATVQGNTVTNAGDHGIWVGAAGWTGSQHASGDAIILNNTVNGAREGGISFVESNGATISNNTITNVAGEGWSVGALSLKDGPSNVEAYNNRIYNNDGAWGEYSGTGHGVGIDGTPSNINLHHNKIYGNVGDGCHNYSTVEVKAENNWWGDASGPGGEGPGTGDKVSTYVDYDPWLGTPTYIVYPSMTTAEIQAVIDAMTAGDTLHFTAGNYPGGFTISKAGIIITGDPGAVIGHGSHGMTVNANDVTIHDLTFDGSSGHASGDCGIVVNDGVQRLYIHDCEIRYWPDDGIHFNGAITGLKIIDNYVHNNAGDGMEFNATPGGTIVQIYGNAFRSNGDDTGYGINAVSPANVTATYNEWGHVDGPTGTPSSGDDPRDAASSGVTYDPWVFGKLWVEADASSVRELDSTTVYVKMDVHHLYGSSFKITFPKEKLQLTAAPTIGGFKTTTDGASFTTNSMADINATGVITFTGYRAGADDEYDATDDILLTLPFQAQEITGVSVDATLAFESDTVDMGAKGGINIFVDSAASDTITILGTTTVSGVVDLQGRGDDSGAVVTFPVGPRYAGESDTTDLWGRYDFADVTDADYISVTVEMERYLDAAAEVTVSGDNMTLNTVVLLGGDANDDDYINIQDLSIIGGQFGNTVDPATVTADINYDGVVNILDLVLAGGNYHETESPWTP